MNEPVLEVQNVSMRFDMTQALDDVSLKLFPGQIHALVGENGAGNQHLSKSLLVFNKLIKENCYYLVT